MAWGLGKGKDVAPRRGEWRSPLLNGEGATAFLGLSLAAQTCAGHKQPLAEGTGSE